jgi:signal transduction histidine kinase
VDWKQLARTYGDSAIAGVLAVSFCIELVSWPDADLAGAIPAALLATLPLAMRRTQPLLTFLLTFGGIFITGLFAPGIDDGGITFLAVFFIALYSLGAHARGRELAVAYLVIVVAIVEFTVNDGDPFQPGDILFATLVVGGPWAGGLALRLRRDSEVSLHERNLALHDQQEALTRAAVATERARISRELHDVVSHAISVTVLQARGARATLGRDEEAVRRALDAIEHTNTQALGDMRRLLAVLRDTEEPSSTAPLPSLAGIGTLLEDVRGAGLSVELHEEGSRRDVPPGVDLSAYRIVQEALTNVLKHAGPAQAVVHLEYGEDALRISVVDNGTTVADGNGSGVGHGLIGIGERVAVVGGEVTAAPRPEGGFEVAARLPYSVEAS